MERTPISIFMGLNLRLTVLSKEEEFESGMYNAFALRRVDNGRIVAVVNRDALFDENGNRFEINI